MEREDGQKTCKFVLSDMKGERECCRIILLGAIECSAWKWFNGTAPGGMYRLNVYIVTHEHMALRSGDASSDTGQPLACITHSLYSPIPWDKVSLSLSSPLCKSLTSFQFLETITFPHPSMREVIIPPCPTINGSLFPLQPPIPVCLCHSLHSHSFWMLLIKTTKYFLGWASDWNYCEQFIQSEDHPQTFVNSHRLTYLNYGFVLL